MATATRDELLQMVRNVVELKMRYWDALRALEDATVTAPDDDWSDASSDAVADAISTLASGLDQPEDAQTHVGDEQLDYVLRQIK